MDPKDVPCEVPVAPIDEYFKAQHPAPPGIGEGAADQAHPPTPQGAEADQTTTPPTAKPAVGDYVRELQLEYDEQQEEGKL
jgi:hypothetical protein